MLKVIGIAVISLAMWLAPPIVRAEPAPARKSDAKLIANARSAGPNAISKGATVIAMEGDKTRVLFKGTSEFTCVPGDRSSPGNDPMCLDRNAMEWLNALMEHRDAPKGKLGLVYMLQGGSDASNNDRFATAPARLDRNGSRPVRMSWWSAWRACSAICRKPLMTPESPS